MDDFNITQNMTIDMRTAYLKNLARWVLWALTLAGLMIASRIFKVCYEVYPDKNEWFTWRRR
ncbi:MAG: hypothetical protein WC052_05185 [Patescibacteria group bacterium]